LGYVINEVLKLVEDLKPFGSTIPRLTITCTGAARNALMVV
jgi:hypothetical protein